MNHTNNYELPYPVISPNDSKFGLYLKVPYRHDKNNIICPYNVILQLVITIIRSGQMDELDGS